MEALQRTFNQYRDIFKSLSASQRGTLVAVTVLIVGAFTYMMFRDIETSYVPVSLGKNFAADELKTAQQALRDAGLGDFRVDGQRILVPVRQVDRYNAALLERGGLPNDWASELEQQLKDDSIFSTDRSSQARRDIALSREINRILRAVPDVADARVLWARSKPQRFSRNGPKVTATVSVRPRGGRELSIPLVQSLRTAVANMIPDLKLDDVIVFDQSTGTSHTAGKEGAFDGRLLSWIRQHTRDYQTRIEQALSYIPDVLVTVTVDVENLQERVEKSRKVEPRGSVPTHEKTDTRNKRSVDQPGRAEPGAKSNVPLTLDAAAGNEQQQTVEQRDSASASATSFTETHREYIAAMPRAVQVTVGIPEDYFRRVALGKGLTEGETDAQKQEFQKAVEGIRTQVVQDVEEKVARHIPAGAPSPADSIHVSTYVPVDAEPPVVEPPWTESVGGAVAQWGGAVGLALFALWALWMLYRSMPKVPEGEPEPAAPLKMHTQTEPDEDEDEDEDQSLESNPRDELQSVVHDNPEFLRQSLGTEGADTILENVRQSMSSVPFGFLQKAGADNLLTFIVEEHPQTIALVMSHLPPALSAEVLSGLPSNKQLEVIRRIAGMEQTNPEVVRDVEASLQKRMTSTFNQQMERAGGVPTVARILNVTDRMTNNGILESLEEEDGDLVEEIRRLMFVFDDLLKLDDQAIQTLLGEIDNSQWAVALKGASEEIKQKIYGNLSQRAAESLEEDMEYLGPVRVSDVEMTQQQIVDAVRRLEDAGEITVSVAAETEQFIA